MKKATQLYLSRLVRAHGSYSHTARALGITPRWMRRIRSEEVPPSCNRTLLMAGKLLLLRELLRELRISGVLTSSQLASAWGRINGKEFCVSEQKPCATDLPHSSTPLPRQW